MTLEELNSNYLPLIQTVFSGASFAGLFLVYWQIRMTRRWNLLQSKYNFIDTTEAPRLEREMIAQVKAVGVRLFGRNFQALQPEEIQKIFGSDEATVAMNHFINDLQNLCASLNYRIIDKKVFEAIHLGRVRWWYRLLHPYVARMQNEIQDPNLWVDFQTVAQAREEPLPAG